MQFGVRTNGRTSADASLTKNGRGITFIVFTSKHLFYGLSIMPLPYHPCGNFDVYCSTREHKMATYFTVPIKHFQFQGI